jgi:sensor histidine kinase regulating citrate/malate metabolism
VVTVTSQEPTMTENLFHAGALAMFVALCIGATSQSGREQAAQVAAQRAATIAAQQAVRSQPAARLAKLQAGAEMASGVQ